MKFRIPQVPAKWIWTGVVVLVVTLGLATWTKWFPAASAWVDRTVTLFRGSTTSQSHGEDENSDPHAGHDHAAHAGHNEATSLELSKQALRNVGLTPDQIRPIKLETFRRSITVPAVVVERPGRTSVQVATPMTGVITHVHAVEGEAVDPGTLLFRIRLTHEDLVQAQTDFVKSLGELEVEEREIKRLSEITNTGAVAGRILLERQYARDKLAAVIKAQREALRLHGLSQQQVSKIENDRRLLSELTILAPSADEHAVDELKLSRVPMRNVAYQKRNEGDKKHTTPLILQKLNVHKGQSVKAGDTLCILADYDELFIEGLAFEQDIAQIGEASEKGWRVDAIFDQAGSVNREVKGLEIAYLANQVDVNSRTLHFYVRLPNEITKDRRAHEDRFVEWRYRPGQRLQLRVPVEEWPEQIVVPVDAVAREGAEYFVFQQNGDHFDRVPVYVKYKDQYAAVIENDGSLFPGDVVAMRGAHQMQMALKNKAGGGVDPHAGHNH